MARDAASELIKVVIETLRSDGILNASLDRRVYDYIPRKTPYPYITAHITDSEEWDTDTDNGEKHYVYVHVWDDKEGANRVDRLLRRVYELLHENVGYSLTDHNLVNMRRTMKHVEREGQLYHGMTTFRAVTEEN